jgi:hypothetical protein
MRCSWSTSFARALGLAWLLCCGSTASAQVLDAQKLLEAQTFWDNRDWEWYNENLPFFECPDAEINTTYYYRWELLTKHLTYGSPDSGYSFTEFIDRPFWSGAYGAISCPAGHQLYEARWLRDPRYARDYARYWFRTPGAQPRNYSTWLADAVWATHLVHPDTAFVKDLLPDLRKNYEAWEEKHFAPAVGLFWQTGHDDGMEYNINSRQTRDILRGAPGYRPTLNAYLWADALAIACVAELAGDGQTAAAYRARADGLKRNLQKKLWDPERRFFFHMFRQDEEADGFKVKALTLTHQTGRFAGSPHGRELIGYVPWQFGLPDGGKGYEAAWKKLMAEDGFAAPFGPTTVERNDPMFVLKKTCCWWSGQSWPYATSQTLKAMANLLQQYEQNVVSKADYLKLLTTFARTHRKDGKPYLAEACHSDTGSFAGHDASNHSEHYFHSSFTDLIITGLVGIKPRADDTVEIFPLTPETWDYFALDQVPYRGRTLSVLWDKGGTRYGRGAGLRILADGKQIAASPRLERLTGKLPPAPEGKKPGPRQVNFAVNNDSHYFPRVTASYTDPQTSLAKLVDGNYWYSVSPPNRWTTEGSPNEADWCAIDFGAPRRIHTVKLYFLDDGAGVVAPVALELETWDGEKWRPVPNQTRSPQKPAGRRANWIRFPERETTKVRARFRHAGKGRTGLTEFEAWGDADGPVPPAPPPAGNLAYNPGGRPFPKASASFTSRFDKVELANDGKVSFAPSPHNRWTSYESPNASDWLEIDFGKPQQVGRVELALYDDRGGVQAPASYTVQIWDGNSWQEVKGQQKTPELPAGGQFNEVRFAPVQTSRLRVVFVHRGKARSGVSEILVWAE